MSGAPLPMASSVTPSRGEERGVEFSKSQELKLQIPDFQMKMSVIHFVKDGLF